MALREVRISKSDYARLMSAYQAWQAVMEYVCAKYGIDPEPLPDDYKVVFAAAE